jgi:hypothetical protein
LMSPLRSIIETVGFRSTVAIESTSQQILLYFIAIAIVGIIIVLANRLDNSPIGRAWTAIREDEVAAIAMGVPLVRMKLLAFATGAACAGAVGVLYGAKQTFVSPESFQLTQSINILAMVIVGGLGGIRGVLLGATVVTLLNLQVLSNFSLQINSLRTAGFVVSGIVIRFIVAIPSLLIAWWGWTLANSAERLKKLAEIPYELADCACPGDYLQHRVSADSRASAHQGFCHQRLADTAHAGQVSALCVWYFARRHDDLPSGRPPAGAAPRDGNAQG